MKNTLNGVSFENPGSEMLVLKIHTALEIFVSCVGDLPSLKRSELVVTPACFSPLFLFFLFFFFFGLSTRRFVSFHFISCYAFLYYFHVIISSTV